ncbi:hypothetical protein BH09BAC6_BH09BAC6_12800 [soil metagenome]|jgi:hypothetical protein
MMGVISLYDLNHIIKLILMQIILIVYLISYLVIKDSSIFYSVNFFYFKKYRFSSKSCTSSFTDCLLNSFINWSLMGFT